MAVMLTFSLGLYPPFLHMQWHTSRWKSGDSVDLTGLPWQAPPNLPDVSRLSLELVRELMRVKTLKLYVGKAQLSSVQKIDPFFVQSANVVSTFA